MNINMRLASLLLLLAVFVFERPGRGLAAPNDVAISGVLGDSDQRVPSESTTWPWTAIGRVNRASGGFCTGTLIAPDRVLTAAHCLYDKRRQRWANPHEVHFLAGYLGGEYRAHGVVWKIVVDPAFRDGPYTTDPLRRDWAILHLGRPIDIRPIEIWSAPAQDLTKAAPNQMMVRAGYGRDHAHRLWMHKGCAIAEVSQGLILHDCDSMPGDSGSPLLLFGRGAPTLIGIHVAVIQHNGRKVGAAVLPIESVISGKSD
jgi:protease YdgD